MTDTELQGAGEDLRVPGQAMATAAEFAAWWNGLDEKKRDIAVKTFGETASIATSCFIKNHDALEEENAALRVAARRRNDREAKWLAQRVEKVKPVIAKAIYAGLISRVQGGQFDAE